MRQAFLTGCGQKFFMQTVMRNLLFYKEVTITNAARSQFDVERYEKLLEESLTICMKAIEGRGR
jgi:hypothetical protein